MTSIYYYQALVDHLGFETALWYMLEGIREFVSYGITE